MAVSVSGVFTFACSDRNVCDQGVQFVGGVLVLITFPGQSYAHPVWHVSAQHTHTQHEVTILTKSKLINMLPQSRRFMASLTVLNQRRVTTTPPIIL